MYFSSSSMLLKYYLNKPNLQYHYYVTIRNIQFNKFKIF